MASHIFLMTLFAFLVSVVFAVLLADDPGSQLRLGAKLFGGFMVSALVLGWVMYPFPL
ncbi:MAG: hypothetical protein ACE148_10625 [Vicinamibacterales bacterium]